MVSSWIKEAYMYRLCIDVGKSMKNGGSGQNSCINNESRNADSNRTFSVRLRG